MGSESVKFEVLQGNLVDKSLFVPKIHENASECYVALKSPEDHAQEKIDEHHKTQFLQSASLLLLVIAMIAISSGGTSPKWFVLFLL